tara:strand:+ start:13412 stop:13537 length:126 start_codon:yes stop_codon:yes gene_type:complete
MSKWEENNNYEKIILPLTFLIIALMIAFGMLVYYKNIKLIF